MPCHLQDPKYRQKLVVWEKEEWGMFILNLYQLVLNIVFWNFRYAEPGSAGLFWPNQIMSLQLLTILDLRIFRLPASL